VEIATQRYPLVPAMPSLYTSPAWKAARKAALIRAHFRCQICGINVSKPGASRVDHIQSARTRPDLALTPTNLRVLCVLHDNQAHREKMSTNKTRNAKFSGCDVSGFPLDPQHHWKVSLGTK